MKRSSIPLSLALCGALLLSFSVVPANAQWFGNGPGARADARSAAITANNFAIQQNNLRSQISSAVSTGRISPGEASQLTSQLDEANAMSQDALASGNMTNDLANQVIGIFASVGNELNSANSFASYPHRYARRSSGYGNRYDGSRYYGNRYGRYY